MNGSVIKNLSKEKLFNCAIYIPNDISKIPLITDSISEEYDKIMKYFEEKKYEEIAEITGTSVGALKASFHHAVSKIEAHIIYKGKLS